MEQHVEHDTDPDREILFGSPPQLNLTTENNTTSLIQSQPNATPSNRLSNFSSLGGSDSPPPRLRSVTSEDHLALPRLPHQSAQSAQSPQLVLHLSSDYGDLLEYDELSELSAFSQEMPPRNSTVRLDPLNSSTRSTHSSGKRRAESPAAGQPVKATRTANLQNIKHKSDDLTQEEIDVVDLRDIENEIQWQDKKAKEAAEAIKAQKQKDATKPIRLADFQCIICMDSPTNLTITHCGHLFCSECLHQALHAGDKKCCPVCRSNINLPKAGGRSTKNGVFALEMKLFTRAK